MPRFILLLLGSLLSTSGWSHEAAQTPMDNGVLRQAQIGPEGSVQLLLSKPALKTAGLEIAHLTLPSGSGKKCTEKPCPGHQHPADEIFYVISGRLEHIVDGVSQVAEPGMLAFAPKNKTVVHNVLSAEPLEVLVIWSTAGEFDRLIHHYGWPETQPGSRSNDVGKE